MRPRAFVAPPWFVASEAAAAARIRDPAVRKGAVALIEGGAPGPVAGSGGQVEVTRYRPEQVDLSVTAPAGGLSALVLNDAWYPGWSATLDGAPVPIRHANLLARGVLVPPGTHRVRFTFPVPVSLEVGAGVSLGFDRHGAPPAPRGPAILPRHRGGPGRGGGVTKSVILVAVGCRSTAPGGWTPPACELDRARGPVFQ